MDLKKLTRGQTLAILGKQKAAEIENLQDTDSQEKQYDTKSLFQPVELSSVEEKVLEFFGPIEVTPAMISRDYLDMQHTTGTFFLSADSLFVDGRSLWEDIREIEFIIAIVRTILERTFEMSQEYNIEEMIIVNENFEPIRATVTEEENKIIVLQNITLPNIILPALTKKGNERKRKPKVSSDKQREAKRKRVVEAHQLRPGCNLECRVKCHTKICEQQRENLNTQFWRMTWILQKSFILAHCSRENVKRRTTPNDTQRKMSIKYHLPNKDGEDQVVCKVFFLTTLGYDRKNDGAVFRVLNQTSKQSILPTIDRRGHKPSSRKVERKSIVDHIESFHPHISHYRRDHAPLARYLPSDVSVTFMHNDYLEKHPGMNISYELYRKVVCELNIHFTKLGHEECENCEVFHQHNRAHTKENPDQTCDVCQKWIHHRAKYTKARSYYQEHSKKEFHANEICVSIDQQKVIMLPRMETFKKVLFTKRISVYHESFVPVGKKQRDRKPFAAVWHEGITGRNKEDVASAYFAFILHHRDVENIIFWADNCSAQNKNWCFLSFLVYIVNSDVVDTRKIEVNYFEPGHSFMSADSFHHQVEKSLTRQKKTCDFDDFIKAVSMANGGKAFVKEMRCSDFFKWEDHHSVQKVASAQPRIYLADVVQVVAERGSNKLKFRTSFESEPQELDFLKKKSFKGVNILPESLTRDAGIKKDVKKEIIRNLGPLMSQNNRLMFWKNLPEC